MSQAPIITKGIPTGSGPNGPVPLRLEIRDLQQNYFRRWSLYIQALTALQGVSQSEWLSYYQLAGIHGLPYNAFNGVGGVQRTGYCTHASILFPTWHRPYLALYEQVLWSIVQNLAGNYRNDQDASNWITAGQNFRMPYWDWAQVPTSDDDVFPDILSSDQVNVILPGTGGRWSSVTNPLARYHFLGHPKGDFPNNSNLSSLAYTARYPDAQGNSDNDQVLQNMGSIVDSLRQEFFEILASYKNYGPFSNKAWTGNPGSYGSLEDVHDNIHGSVGGDGHMGQVPFSAFDPVFWLHHTNVDRGFAIWVALNPNSYVTPQKTQWGTFTTASNGTEDVNTDLTPFWQGNNAFWKSNGVKQTIPLGYAYPETQSWNYPNASAYQQSVQGALRNLYGSGSLGSLIQSGQQNIVAANISAASRPSLLAKRPENIKKDSAIANVATVESLKPMATSTPTVSQSHGVGQQSEHQNISPVSHGAQKPVGNALHDSGPTAHGGSGRKLADLAPEGKYLEWTVNTRAKKHALNGPFYVYVFLGDYDRNDHSSWAAAAEHIGTVATLGDSEATSCGKCKDDRESQLVVTGQVPLTLDLARHYLDGRLASLSPNDVVLYLQKELHWQVVLADGTPVTRGEIGSLKVSVISNEVTVPANDTALPTYADEVAVHPAATTNASGGARGEGTGITREEDA